MPVVAALLCSWLVAAVPPGDPARAASGEGLAGDAGVEPAGGRAGALRGVVVSDGVPAAGARVTLLSFSAAGFQLQPDPVAIADSQGRFSLEVGACGWCRVLASAGGRHASLLLDPKQPLPSPEARLELAPPGSLLVQVRAEGPLKDVRVSVIEPLTELRLASPRGGPLSLGTPAREVSPGLFRADGLLPLVYQVRVEADGQLTSWRSALVRPGEPETVEVSLARAVPLVGKLRLASGRPAAGAQIEARLEQRSGEARVDPAAEEGVLALQRESALALSQGREARLLAKADERGELYLPGLEPGLYRVEVRHPDSERLVAELRLPGPPLRVVLQPGAFIEGVALDASGKLPVGGVVVQGDRCEEALPELCEARGAPQTALVDAAGRFRLGPLEPGWHRLVTVGRLPLQAHVLVKVRRGERLRVVLRPPSLPGLEGLALDEQDRRVAGAVVRARCPADGRVFETRSDRLGRFRFENLNPCVLSLSARSPGRAVLDAKATAGELATRLVLMPVGPDGDGLLGR